MKIIIVDDEINACESLENQMKQIPQISLIKIFVNALEALDYAKANPIDVAFLDIDMPEIDGLQTALRLKAVNPKVNIVFVSAYSQYAINAYDTEPSDYLLKPATAERIRTALSRLRNPVILPSSRIRVQTFGNFEIFADGKPIVFSRSKSKELLAYLIDRHGAGVEKKELAAILWDDDSDYSRSRQQQLQVIISEMIKSLKAVDADCIIIRGHNNLSVDITKIDCDYYRYLKGNVSALNLFMGEYMSNYSWAELTAAALNTEKQNRNRDDGGQ